MRRNRIYRRKTIKSDYAWELSGRIVLIFFFSNLYPTDLGTQLSVDVHDRNRLEARNGYREQALTRRKKFRNENNIYYYYF